MQPVPKAAYNSDFRENTNFCPQRGVNLGPLAQQASVLPPDHCDLECVYSEPRLLGVHPPRQIPGYATVQNVNYCLTLFEINKFMN